MKIELTQNDVSDLKKIRNYFGENDKTSFEHLAYVTIGRLLNKIESENEVISDHELEKDVFTINDTKGVDNKFNPIEHENAK